VANEANATKQGPGDDEDGVHRLRDIVVEEVSLVDRAANKRRFLVVKRSDGMAKAKQGNDSKTDEADAAAGSKKTKKKTKAKPVDDEMEKARRRAAAAGDEEEETEKARRRPPLEDEEDETEKARSDDDDETEKARDDDDDETEKVRDDAEEDDDAEAEKVRSHTKAAAGRRPKTNGESKNGTTEKAEDDDEDDDEDEDEIVLAPAVKNAVLRVLAQALERLMAVANRIKDADEPDDETDASVPEDLADELDDIGELLEGVGERLPTAKGAVAKGGARMAKDRLDRFQKALALLSEVLKELTDGKEPKEPTAGAAEKKLAKRDAVPGMADVVASIGELTRVVKRQEEQLVQMRKTRGTSNAIPIDGGRRERREPQDVSTSAETDVLPGRLGHG